MHAVDFGHVEQHGMVVDNQSERSGIVRIGTDQSDSIPDLVEGSILHTDLNPAATTIDSGDGLTCGLFGGDTISNELEAAIAKSEISEQRLITEPGIPDMPEESGAVKSCVGEERNFVDGDATEGEDGSGSFSNRIGNPFFPFVGDDIEIRLISDFGYGIEDGRKELVIDIGCGGGQFGKGMATSGSAGMDGARRREGCGKAEHIFMRYAGFAQMDKVGASAKECGYFLLFTGNIIGRGEDDDTECGVGEIRRHENL